MITGSLCQLVGAAQLTPRYLDATRCSTSLSGALKQRQDVVME